MTNNGKDHFPRYDYGDKHRAAFVRESPKFVVGCPNCGRRNESAKAPTAKRPVKCTGCGLELLPTE